MARIVSRIAPWALLLAGVAAAVPALAQTGAARPTEIARLDPGLDAVIAPGTVIERVATGFKFVEGPMWREGRLWFSDLSDDKVYALSPDGKTEVLIAHAGGLDPFPEGSYLGSNAMATDKDGSVLLVQQGGRKIVRLDAQLRPQPFITAYQGKAINSPNDLVFAPDGALWFTDPPFGLPKMDADPGKQLPYNAVWRYANGTLTPVITDLTLPNGIAFSPDGKTLYVSNFGSQMYVKAWDVAKDGTVSNGRMLIEYPKPSGPGGPDGMKVDSAGNIWTTGPGGIRIITPAGKVLGQIRLPETAANLAFAEDGRTVYITASKSVYRLHTRIAGQMPLYRR
ncbi:SMP-30/gluconolactonase/LRE family protein [Sphingomonas sp. CJ20]